MFQNRALTEAIAIGRQMAMGNEVSLWSRLADLDREVALSLPWPMAKGATMALVVSGYTVNIDSETRWKLATELARTVMREDGHPGLGPGMPSA